MNRLEEIYERFFGCFAYLTSLLLFVLRLHWGALFMNAGGGKMSGPEGVVNFFTSLGMPFPEFTVKFVGCVEYYGGALLIIGLLSRVASLPLFITMVVAMLTAHMDGVQAAWQSMSVAPLVDQGPFHFMVVTLLVMILGPGKLSVDAVVKGIRGRM